MKKKNSCVVCFYNEWGVRVDLFTGTEAECQEWLEKLCSRPANKWPAWITDEPSIENL